LNEETNLLIWLSNNWEVVFLYGLKYVNDINKILTIHETEIKNLKDNVKK